MKFVTICLLGASIMASTAHATTAKREQVALLADKSPVEIVTLANAHGISARILTYGATLQSLIAPDRKGKRAEITLGHDDPSAYEKAQNFFGVTVGRYANRIAKGRFTLDGTEYQLPRNNGENSLHGGGQGFDRRNWVIESVKQGSSAKVSLILSSPDGEMGYPGRVDARVTYSLDEKGELSIVFEASTDKPTIINMTNHALFNLAGDGNAQGAMGQRLTIPASRFLPVDETLIPTGELRAVAGSVFDFTKGRIVSEGLRSGQDLQIVRGRGYDHNFVLDKGQTATPQLAARLEDPGSGRVLEVLTTEPGIQLYSGNFLDGTPVGRSNKLYRMGDGIALEPQKFPDTPNHPAFGSARIEPGKPYRHEMIYRLSVSK